MPNDPKWRTIARVSGQPITAVIAVYIHLLVNASLNVTTCHGVSLRGHIDVTTEDLASALDVTEEVIDSILQAMQGRVLDGDLITGWEKRQVAKEDNGNVSTTAKSPAERKRAQREREKLRKQNEECHDDSRICHDTSLRVTTDKDKDKDLKTDPPLNPPRGNCGVKKFDPMSVVLPDWLPEPLWREWVEFRQALRKPIRTEQGAIGSIRELQRFRAQGFSPEDVIRHSIAHEYQGLFAPTGIRAAPAGHQVNTISQPDRVIPPGFRG